MATRVPTAGLVLLTMLAISVTTAVWHLRPLSGGTAAAGGGDRDVDREFADPAARRRLAWIDRAGRQTPIDAPPRGYVYPRLSPDGRQVAVDIRDDQHGLWIWDVAGAVLLPLSIGRASDIAPVWSRSGGWLLFARGRGVSPGLFRLVVGSHRRGTGDTAGGGERLPGGSNSLLMPSSLAPDDRHVIVTASVASGFDILAIDLADRGTPMPLVTGAADDLNGELSPDGRWLAYQSRRSGQFEIWVKRWGSDGPGQPVTSTGGTRPVWTRGGREIVYLTHDGDMMALAFSDLPVGIPQRLFKADIYRDLVGRTFDVTPGGERFLVVVGL